MRKPQIGRAGSEGRLPTDRGLDLAIVALRAGRRCGPKGSSRLCDTGVASGAEGKEPGVDLMIESGIRWRDDARRDEECREHHRSVLSRRAGGRGAHSVPELML